MNVKLVWKIFLCFFVVLLPGPLLALEFLPHRAVYDLRPDGTGVEVQLDGRLVLELSASCEDYQLNQRMVTRLRAGEQQRLNDFRVALAEGRDGLRLGFASEHYVNGTLDEARFGQATLDRVGGAGSVLYRKPAGETEPLPAGTAFPVAFNNRLLASALAGERQVRVLLFDGSSDGMRETVSFIGRRQAPAAAGDAVHELLAGIDSWPVQTGYYPLATQASVPEFEVHFRLYANGVSDDVVLDYGDLRLRGTLVELAGLAIPDCD